MAVVKPFCAVRYDERRAGPISTLIAPPYDVIDGAARARYLAASPYNVVHLTLPDSEQAAAEPWREWLGEGVLVEDDEPTASVACSRTTSGPTASRDARDGLVCALRLEPYANGVVLPHERTHAGPKEGRLRLLRALRAQVEPIFLLFDGTLEGPGGDPDARRRARRRAQPTVADRGGGAGASSPTPSS